MKLDSKIRQSLIDDLKKLNRLSDKLDNCRHYIKQAVYNDTIDEPTQAFINSVKKKADIVSKSFEYSDKYEYIEDKFPPTKGVTPEREYFRDISYSIFHRSLGINCSVIDLDFIEFRDKSEGSIPVLVYDIKISNSDTLKKYLDEDKFYKYIAKKYLYIAKKLNVPYWLVIVDEKFARFDVGIIEDIGRTITWNKHPSSPLRKKEYADLIQKL